MVPVAGLLLWLVTLPETFQAAAVMCGGKKTSARPALITNYKEWQARPLSLSS